MCRITASCCVHLLKKFNMSQARITGVEDEEVSFCWAFHLPNIIKLFELGDEIVSFTVSCSCNRNSSTNSVCLFCL